ncbi:hypothetical protein CERSUDRAFT_94735 [Gelatoporia subvermispora B]|uniref:Uncharacterized protein n=1 Tax=Ceriporiopsis subvermispora (strain B) TaxID=914234 RepID=M2QZR4_CERS8|nr:hypothetical protein CERSUDRAFT_94735 [Gelatoporia subvermispora B]
MDDFDDYFDDDIVVDEDVLAILDEEETKFTETQRLTERRSPHSPPPAKRQKLNHPSTERFSRTTSIDFEDLPEVSVVGDGTYGLFGSNLPPGLRDTSENTSASKFHANIVTGKDHRTHAATAFGRIEQPQPNRHRPPERAVSRGSSHTGPPRLQQAEHASDSLPTGRKLQNGHVGLDEVQVLHTQLEELRRAQEQITNSLKEAQDARLAKEGEVTILRKNIEKDAQRHAAELAKLKAAKEAAEAVQRQHEQDMKEEMERLKTQYTFKQLELETSLRRPPWTARTKRLDKQLPLSPLRPPSQIRGWNQDSVPGPSVPRTPSRMRISHTFDKSPQKTPNKKRVENTQKATMLPGFFNSFAASPSVTHTTMVEGKGKEKETGGPDGDWNPFADARTHQPSPLNSPSGRAAGEPDSSDPVIPDPTVDPPDPTNGQDDVEMADVIPTESPADVTEQVESPNWREQIHRIIMTHILSQCDKLTIQTLMSQQLPSDAPPNLAQLYSTSCAKLLQSLAVAASESEDLEAFYQAISDSLTSMGLILTTVASMPALIAILNLIRVLIYRIPFFTASLLSVPVTSESNTVDAPPRILEVLVQSVRRHMPTKDGRLDDVQLSVMAEALLVLEALALHAPQDLVMRLSYFPRSFQVLLILLEPTQPTQVLYRTVRALSFLATRESLFRQLLAFQYSQRGDDEPLPQDFSKIPHIERMAYYLIDRSRSGPEANMLRETILKLVATLSAKHTDAVAVLLGSQIMIPSIVLFLVDLMTPLFEDDEELQNSPSMVTWTIDIGVRTLYTLYSLVFSGNGTPFNLYQKLLHEPGRAYYAVLNMFIVTLGRLSFADTPDWISGQDRVLLEECTEVAKELLDLLVDGPEIEQVWSAFQPIENMETEDDDEVEARAHHPD